MLVLTIGLSEFKRRLSFYLVKAENGEIIKLTSHNKLVAHVFPPQKVFFADESKKTRKNQNLLDKANKKAT